ncbi:uncharacterized protein LOC120255309 [Dioscorea cayenensis subsp. rotundata]|uniref:Uncharacterized protein LOC120255309 n=1 Tax=Dioscorea cayennensis subsp. rotundata TaxID=55577 RepID=A0AB40AVC7_DIOCR|nr:uncharacterized protein LOC120255309 [Dioscorea cayenensis subsp. rotundata]
MELHFATVCFPMGSLIGSLLRYRHLVGSLVYLVVTRSRHFSCCAHSRPVFVAALTSSHYGHLLRSSRYLRSSMPRGLFYSHQPSLDPQPDLDATWASPMMIGSLSSAHYKRCFWIRSIPEDFGVPIHSPIPILLRDATEPFRLRYDPVKHESTKHIGVDAHFTALSCPSSYAVPPLSSHEVLAMWEH